MVEQTTTVECGSANPEAEAKIVQEGEESKNDGAENEPNANKKPA